MCDRTYMDLVAMCTLSSISKLKYHVLHSSAKMARHLLGPKMPAYYGTDKSTLMSLLCGYSMPNEYLKSCH